MWHSLVLGDTSTTGQLSSGNQGINTAFAYNHYADAEMNKNKQNMAVGKQVIHWSQETNVHQALFLNRHWLYTTVDIDCANLVTAGEFYCYGHSLAEQIGRSIASLSHFSCATGAWWSMCTCTAANFSFFGGIRHRLYVTSSPSFGTMSPSILSTVAHQSR